MDHNSDNTPANTAALMQSMALLATLQTAFDVWESVRDRRAGIDPSEQETEASARFYLSRHLNELRQLYHQLVLCQIAADREDTDRDIDDRETQEQRTPLAEPVRRFDLLTKLSRTARLLQSVHQRLLSLYPLVGDDLVEEARVLQRFTEELAAGEDVDITLRALLSRLHQLMNKARAASRP